MTRRLQLGRQVVDSTQVPKLDFSEDGKSLILTFGIISKSMPTSIAADDPEKRTHRDIKPREGGSIYGTNLTAEFMLKDEETPVLNITMVVNSKVPGTGG